MQVEMVAPPYTDPTPVFSLASGQITDRVRGKSPDMLITALMTGLI